LYKHEIHLYFRASKCQPVYASIHRDVNAFLFAHKCMKKMNIVFK